MGNRCSDCPEYQHLLGENARLLQTLEHLKQELTLERERSVHASRDPLTGLFNRHELEQHAERFLETIARRGHPSRREGDVLSFCFIDMNGLKQINDTYGHEAGDKAIIFLAKIITENVRDGDIVARAGSGADEFGIIFPDTSLAEARKITEKIKYALRRRQLKIDGTHMQVRAAFGVASTSEGLVTRSELFRAADDRMYKHKARGRKSV